MPNADLKDWFIVFLHMTFSNLLGKLLEHNRDKKPVTEETFALWNRK